MNTPTNRTISLNSPSMNLWLSQISSLPSAVARFYAEKSREIDRNARLHSRAEHLAIENEKSVLEGLRTLGSAGSIELEALLGISESCIRNHLKNLVDKGLVKRISRRPAQWEVKTH